MIQVLVKKHLKNLTKAYHCLRAEVLKKIKCYKCQKSGHFAKDCNVDAEDGDDDFDEDISDEEIQMPQANGESKKKEPPSLRGTPFLRCGHKRRQ